MKLKKKSLTIIGIIIIFLVACFLLIYENMGKTSDFKVIDESKKIDFWNDLELVKKEAIRQNYKI